MNTINRFHSDLWQVIFSNIPVIYSQDELDLFSSYVRSVIIPEYGVNFDESVFKGRKIQHPITPKENIELGLLQIDFKLAENLKNYLYLFDWVYKLRGGINVPSIARTWWTEVITVTMLDNQKRTTGYFKFKHAFCNYISPLSLTYGTGEELQFTTNFSYEDIEYVSLAEEQE